jgi:hypothetical protein
MILTLFFTRGEAHIIPNPTSLRYFIYIGLSPFYHDKKIEIE